MDYMMSVGQGCLYQCYGDLMGTGSGYGNYGTGSGDYGYSGYSGDYGYSGYSGYSTGAGSGYSGYYGTAAGRQDYSMGLVEFAEVLHLCTLKAFSLGI